VFVWNSQAVGLLLLLSLPADHVCVVVDVEASHSSSDYRRPPRLTVVIIAQVWWNDLSPPRHISWWHGGRTTDDVVVVVDCCQTWTADRHKTVVSRRQLRVATAIVDRTRKHRLQYNARLLKCNRQIAEHDTHTHRTIKYISMIRHTIRPNIEVFTYSPTSTGLVDLSWVFAACLCVRFFYLYLPN